MNRYVLGFQEIDRTQAAIVGGKGTHLGELSRIDGVSVPAGLCVTTDAFRRIVAEAPSIDDRLDRLSRLKPEDRETIGALSAEIRGTFEAIVIPDDVAAAITRSLTRLGEHTAYAVRSSATAEDSLTASFAGQHATYLNVVGPASILQHVSRCWASLFTERAVTYRLRNGLDHKDVHMAVVGQQMVFSQAAWPITTLFPIPDVDDGDNHVYVSVGHQQMMIDPMKPLGLSVWQLTSPAPMVEAGGRLFVDVTRGLASPASRAGLLRALGKSDSLIGDALQTILDRDDFIGSLPEKGPGGAPAGGAPAPLQTDPAIVADLIQRTQASIATLKRDIQTKSGSALLDFILGDIKKLQRRGLCRPGRGADPVDPLDVRPRRRRSVSDRARHQRGDRLGWDRGDRPAHL